MSATSSAPTPLPAGGRVGKRLVLGTTRRRLPKAFVRSVVEVAGLGSPLGMQLPMTEEGMLGSSEASLSVLAVLPG